MFREVCRLWFAVSRLEGVCRQPLDWCVPPVWSPGDAINQTISVSGFERCRGRSGAVIGDHQPRPALRSGVVGRVNPIMGRIFRSISDLEHDPPIVVRVGQPISNCRCHIKGQPGGIFDELAGKRFYIVVRTGCHARLGPGDVKGGALGLPGSPNPISRHYGWVGSLQVVLA